ncbi:MULTISPECIES: hypothetical protein [Niastella]|uniref:Uncharacterized protein n=1 Tax=Niastella soli TaxID=2821487 RepID=A0ABS3YSJ6_9BACT|nr:hypothetical protein [Niastella soli]MBO9200838.1 hypothetical protein [Niastella soli]
MKPITLILVTLVSFIAKSYCQSAGGQEFGEDIKSWLKLGEHKVDIMTVKQNITPRQIELSNKVRQAMTKNAAWVRDSLPNVTDSTLIYEKFGLTKAEFDEYLLSGEKKSTPELVKTGEETLVITRKKNSLVFQGTGRLKVLDSIRFNTALNEPLYNGKELELTNKSGVDNSDNPFKSPWNGYHFTYEHYGDVMDNDPKNLTASTITFDVGQIKDSGNTILMFMLMNFEGGKMTQSSTVICLFK